MPQEPTEFGARLAKAQAAAKEAGVKALVMESGAAMMYLTGVRWGRSERTFATVIPVSGDPSWVVPGFEEQRARELIKTGKDIRVWQEDESPFGLIATILKDRGVTSGKVAIDEAMRFFIFDGLRTEAPKLEFVSAKAIFEAVGMPAQPAGGGRRGAA